LPDGRRIVSRSSNGTIRVWNANMRASDAEPFIGHMDSDESVAFSPDGQCIVSSGHGSIMLNAMTGNTETTRHVDLTDRSMINQDGWMCSSKGELLMWIPRIHRAHLHRLGNIWVAGEHETRMDLSTFVHGRNWATCINT